MNDKLLNLKKLRSFLTVADTNNFAKAAELLHYSPASLTIQIQALEQDLDVTLFDRIGKRIYLTNEGVQLYSYAQEFLRLNDEALDAFDKTQPQGHLRIGTIASLAPFLFPYLLRRFYMKYPGVSVSVVTDTPAVLYQKLAYNELDLLIVLDEPLVKPDLNTIMRVPISVVPCVSREHPLADQMPISIDTMLTYPCILTEADASYRRIFEHLLARFGYYVTPVFESDNVDLILSLLHDTNFYSVLPSIFLDAESSKTGIVPFNVEKMDLSIQMQIFCNQHKYISKDLQAFVDVAKGFLYRAFPDFPNA